MKKLLDLFFGERLPVGKHEKKPPKSEFAKKQQALQLRADMAKKGRVFWHSPSKGTYDPHNKVAKRVAMNKEVRARVAA